MRAESPQSSEEGEQRNASAGSTWDPALPASPGVHHAGGGTATVSRRRQLRVLNALVPGVSHASAGGFEICCGPRG